MFSNKLEQSLFFSLVVVQYYPPIFFFLHKIASFLPFSSPALPLMSSRYTQHEASEV